MLRVVTKKFIIGLDVLALAVAAGCQRQADGPPAGEQAGSNVTASVETGAGSTALTEVTLNVTGMS